MFSSFPSGYPLAVKLGTISGDGKADVYSYAEDDMVEDPLLKQHLAHFGINMEGMQKVNHLGKVLVAYVSTAVPFLFHAD